MDDIIKYIQCTFLYSQLTFDIDNSTDIINDLRSHINICIEYLLKNEFIQLNGNNIIVFLRDIYNNDTICFIEIDKNCFVPTQLGSAALTSSLPPDEALFVFADLQNAQRNFVLDTDLHLLYLVRICIGDSDVIARKKLL